MSANWFDHAIATVAPRMAARRVLARQAFETLTRGYDGASKGRRTDGWRAPGSSADTEIGVAGALLRDRMRDLVRNNPHAAKAVAVLVNNITRMQKEASMPESTTTVAGDVPASTETRQPPVAAPANSEPAAARMPDAPATPDSEAIATRAREAERDRVSTIYDLTGRLNLERSFADDLVKRGVSVDESRRLILDQIAAKSDETRTFPHVSVPLGGRDERITRRDAVANALLHRYSPTLFPLEDAARQYRGMTLLELARESLGNAGVNTRGLSRDEVATRALHSTSDFPEILSAVTNKTLRQAYDAYPRTFALFCRQVLATDFKSMHRVQLGEAPQLLEVGESGEFKRGTLGESKESYRVKTYGRVVAITRQVLINDDLDAFTRIPAMYGNSIAQLESDVVWGIITANPAMADGNALFHTTHKNLAATGAALDVASVGAARAAMALQTGLDKKTVLNIRPAFLIVPAALELKAEQLVAQNLVPADSAKVVPQSIRTLSPISEPRLDAASATSWYLAASPNQIDTIEYAYLEGQQGAYIERRASVRDPGRRCPCTSGRGRSLPAQSGRKSCPCDPRRAAGRSAHR
ncbi:lambda family portal protein [Cereibacter ovatus]|uniref:Lambda family portal protein n=1 Tax=Cereibacter ovatus TaxID=439529 RepID=A0A285D077_9RHOB|nr:prohead protease/major capsid protein fusion protein [Cereibacter ovatus]SNX73159.1 lambda family portal protein [Cereibacter ovatus]